MNWLAIITSWISDALGSEIWSAILQFASMVLNLLGLLSKSACVVLLCVALAGCVTGNLKGETITADGATDTYSYRTVAIVPPFGKLAEQANQYAYTSTNDGGWSITSGQTNAGIDASGQIQALQLGMEAIIKAMLQTAMAQSAATVAP